MSATKIANIIENYSLERFLEEKFIRDIDDVTQREAAARDEIRQATKAELDLLDRHWKNFLEDLAEHIVLIHGIEHFQESDQQSYFMIGQEQDVVGQLASYPNPVVEVAYQRVLAHKQRALATVPCEFPQAVFEYYESMQFGWQVGQTFGYCMVQGTWHEALNTIDERNFSEDDMIPEAMKPKIETFQIIPSSLDGVALKYLFGVEDLLLTDPRNGLTLHEDLAKLLFIGAAVVVPIPPDDGNQIRWKFVLTWKPTGDKKWNGVSQKKTFEQFDGLELKFTVCNRPAARFLYFRFMLTYMYWIKRADDGKTEGCLDWVKDVQENGSLWAVPGPYLRRRFLGKLTSLLCGRALPLLDYKECTFMTTEGSPERGREDEDRFVGWLKEKIEKLIYVRPGPERLNS